MAKSPSVSPAFPVREFFARFPDERACLEHIMRVRFGGTTLDCPSCGVEGAVPQASRSARLCLPALPVSDRADCEHRSFRTRGRRSFRGFMRCISFCTTRHGVSGKELQRQLGVTYKTAWRIAMQIRKLTEKTERFRHAAFRPRRNRRSLHWSAGKGSLRHRAITRFEQNVRREEQRGWFLSAPWASSSLVRRFFLFPFPMDFLLER